MRSINNTLIFYYAFLLFFIVECILVNYLAMNRMMGLLTIFGFTFFFSFFLISIRILLKSYNGLFIRVNCYLGNVVMFWVLTILLTP